MSKGDNFGSGFVLGTVIGGLVGTVVGIVIGSRSNEISEPKQSQPLDEELESKPLLQEEITENLEGKISQLSSAIEEVRQKLNLKDQT